MNARFSDSSAMAIEGKRPHLGAAHRRLHLVDAPLQPPRLRQKLPRQPPPQRRQQPSLVRGAAFCVGAQGRGEGDEEGLERGELEGPRPALRFLPPPPVLWAARRRRAGLSDPLSLSRTLNHARGGSCCCSRGAETV